MLGRRRLWSHHRLHAALLRSLGSSTLCSSASIKSDAQSRLLEHWSEFDATKLSPEQMEALMLMAHWPGDQRAPEEIAKAFQSQFEKVSDDRKALLVQKVAALSGLQSMAPLLAWSAVSIKHHLEASMKFLAARAADSSGSSSSWPVYYGDLLSLARAAGHCSEQSEVAGLAAYLAAPSSLSWHDLLGMPHLEHLLAEVSAGDAMLSSMLRLLGVLNAEATPPPLPLPLEQELWQLRRAAEQGLSREAEGDGGPGQAAAAAAMKDAITTRLCRFIEAELNLGHSPDTAAPPAYATSLMRLLRVARPIAQPPQGTHAQPPQGKGGPLQHAAADKRGRDEPGASSSGSSSGSNGSSSSSGGSGSSSGGGSGSSSGGGSGSSSRGGGARTGSGEALGGCFSGPPVVMGLLGGAELAGPLQQIAAQLVAGLGDGVGLERLQGASHAQVRAALARLAARADGGPAAVLVGWLQALRKQLLMAGDVPTLVSATSSDLEALEPQEFWGLYRASKRADLVGSTLMKSLLQPSALTHPDSSSSSSSSKGVRIHGSNSSGGGSSSSSSSSSRPLDLRLVWSLPESDRTALAWVLLRGAGGGRAGGGHMTGSSQLEQVMDLLYRGFEAHAVAVYRDRATAAQAAADLARAAQLEYDLSEVNYVDDGPPPLLSLLSGPSPNGSCDASLSDPTTLLSTPSLPPPEQLARARAALPSSQLLLFDLLGDEAAGGGAATELQVHLGFEALRKEVQGLQAGAQAEEQLHLPPAYATWAAETKQRLLGLSPPALALLSKFLELRLARRREDATEATTRLKLLLREVAQALGRAEDLRGAGSKPKRDTRATSGTVNPYWASADGPQQGQAGTHARDPYAQILPSPEDVRALLGGGGEGFYSAEGEAAEFEAWLRSEALLGAESGAKQRKQEGKAQPYELLAAQHLDMDIQRFLTMEHDPQLHMCFEGAAPRPWRDPEGAALNEEAFLDSMRPLLDRYLEARGMRPLLDGEWMVYAGAALEEWSHKRSMHEDALRAVGQSAFFNSRAESVYLRQLVAMGIPQGAPLWEQAQRYMAVLERNPSWSFAQRKHAAKRLIELSAHFARQPPPSERGSPFAPLFAAAGTGDGMQLLAPSLARPAKVDGRSVTPKPQGF